MTDRDALIAELRWCLDEGSQGPRSAKALAAALDALAAPPPAPPADLVAIVARIQNAEAESEQAAVRGDMAASIAAAERGDAAYDDLLAYPLPAAPPRAAIEQAARLIRLWSADRMRATGKWTAQEQAGIECAIQLEAALAPPGDPLLVSEESGRREAAGDAVTSRGGECPTCGGVWPCGRCTTSAVDLDALKARLKADAAPPQEPPR